MSYSEVQTTLGRIVSTMAEIAPHRPRDLFSEFLIKGYSAVSLNSVMPCQSADILRAKICLGTLITLYDDYADLPQRQNPVLLDGLYKLGFGKHSVFLETTIDDRRTFEFAVSLFSEIDEILHRQPHHRHFRDVLNFDLAQFYSANQYSSLITTMPSINSHLENRLYTHHNMGMVMVAMIDLMATEKIHFSELGIMREVFLMGQRLGRIFNVLATRKREYSEGDLTGELSLYNDREDSVNAERVLRLEIRALYKNIAALDSKINTFSVRAYLEGLSAVQRLHECMEGVI